MELTKTIILKIADGDSDLVSTMQRYAEGMNYASAIVFAKKKLMAAMKLQRKAYAYLRNVLGLKSQVSCNIPRQVAGAYKTLREKGRWQLLSFRPSSMTLSYKRDFTFDGDTISITTLVGRKTYRLLNYEYAKRYLDGSWKYLASKVCLHRDGNHYLHLGLERKVTVPNLKDAKRLMGVDVGMNYLAVASTVDGKQRFFCGRRMKDARNRYCGMRARLQAKGTLSAKRLLKRLSGKEKRLMRSVNHNVSKQVVAFAEEQGVDVIGLENLNGIRERTIVRQGERYWHSSWAFRQLQSFIEYKAAEAGILVVYVDGAYTSRTCPHCGHVDENNRHRLRFRCTTCGYELNADLVGARNIEHRTRDFRQALESQGYLSATQTPALAVTGKPRPSGRGS